MNKKPILLWTALVWAMTAFAQTPVTGLEGVYAPADTRGVEQSILILQRTRSDTIRIIICDTSLFRNDLLKGPMLLYPHGREWYCSADNFKGRARFDRETGLLTITPIHASSREMVVGRWRRLKRK